MLVWHPDLPRSPLISDYNEAISDGRTRSSVTSGVGKARAFWKGVRKLIVPMNMTDGQWATLNRFWEDTTKHGVLPFLMPKYPETGQELATDTNSLVLTSSGGDTITAVVYALCRFGDSPPSITTVLRTDFFKVSIPIDVLP